MKNKILIVMLFILAVIVSIYLFSGCKKKEDSSNNKFIRVLTPNGSDTLQIGNTLVIKWEDNFDDDIFIQIYRGSTMALLINRATESDGEYEWLIPSGMANDSCYKLRITNLSDQTVYDESDQYFRITPQSLTFPYIRVITPNGGEIWSLQGTYLISWTRNFSGLVKVLLVNNGVIQGEVPGNGTTGNSMYVTFGVGTYYATGNKIRVCDASNYNIYDESDGEFNFTN